MREQKVWIASDLHLGHAMLTWPNHKDGTPREGGALREAGYEEKFLQAANDIVMPNDILCFLGDMAFSNVAYWFTRICSLPGKKMLILGNHDQNRIKWYQKFGFMDVIPFGQSRVYRHELGNILLTHIPAFEDVLTSYDARYIGQAKKHNNEFEASSAILNIHGHTHGKAKERHNTFDASLECINYAPISIDMIVDAKLKSRGI